MMRICNHEGGPEKPCKQDNTRELFFQSPELTRAGIFRFCKPHLFKNVQHMQGVERSASPLSLPTYHIFGVGIFRFSTQFVEVSRCALNFVQIRWINWSCPESGCACSPSHFVP